MNIEGVKRVVAEVGFPLDHQSTVCLAILKAFHEYRRAAANNEPAPHVQSRERLAKFSATANQLLRILNGLSVPALSSLGQQDGQWNVDRWRLTLSEIQACSIKAYGDLNDANRKDPKLKEFDDLLTGLILAWCHGWAKDGQITQSRGEPISPGIVQRGKVAEGGIIRYEGPLLDFVKRLLKIEGHKFNPRGFGARLFDLHPLNIALRHVQEDPR